jgi:GxxExxY protein
VGLGGARHENEISERIISAAIEVHRHHGPGLVDQIYEESLCHEVHLRGLGFERQKPVPILDMGITLGVPLRLDMVVEGKVILDLKAKEEITALDKATLLSYLRLLRLQLGRIVHFHSVTLKEGIYWIVNGLHSPPQRGSFSL